MFFNDFVAVSLEYSQDIEIYIIENIKLIIV
jgi:hypothetical protein